MVKESRSSRSSIAWPRAVTVAAWYRAVGGESIKTVIVGIAPTVQPRPTGAGRGFASYARRPWPTTSSIRGGTVVDGTGAPAFTADVAVDGGTIVAVGRVTDRARKTIDADGLLITPGFVDVHTHYDGQATWDPHLTPSCWQGVTTAILGNCGVGFAPARPGHDAHVQLVELMEGVEDIPGTALYEGIRWEWETFPEYLDALERMPRVIDVGTHVPHAAVRAYVMGERAAGRRNRRRHRRDVRDRAHGDRARSARVLDRPDAGSSRRARPPGARHVRAGA